MKDTFDDTFGPDSANFRGYDEANDYDREMEKPENMKWDDEDWKGYQKSFTDLEKEALNSNLKESELVKQIGEATLGEEIRRSVDGKAGIQNVRDRGDLSMNIDGAQVGWEGVAFGRQMY